MSKEDFAGVGLIDLASGSLRIESATVWSWSWSQPNADPEPDSAPAAPSELEVPQDFEEALSPASGGEGGMPAAFIPDFSIETAVARPVSETAVADPVSETTADGAAEASAAEVTTLGPPQIRPPSRDEAIVPLIKGRRRRRYGLMLVLATGALFAPTGWLFNDTSGICLPSDQRQLGNSGRLAAATLARRIVRVESNGNATARNARSSATGAGQFLDATWLEMIRAYRPDLASQERADILALRYDADLSREMVARFAERNAAMLADKCLPVTPGTLYLSHFAGGAGAAAVLTAPEYADAADIMANADSTGHTTREMIVTANPFLASFTIADLKAWAERKMRAAKGNRVSAR